MEVKAKRMKKTKRKEIGISVLLLVESFSSSASWNTQIGTVNANAEFHHPILSSRNAWSQVQVDKDGNVYQDGAIY